MKLLRAKPYTGQPVRFSHVKRNGHRLVLSKDRLDACTALTSLPTDITELVRHRPWFQRFVVHAPSSTDVEGELWYPGRPPSAVKTALVEDDPALRFSVFAVPRVASFPHYDEGLDFVENCCTLWGLTLCPWCEVSGEFDAEELLALALVADEDTEGLVLKVANYWGWYKLKPVKTVDLIICGFREGEGKFLGLVGSLRCCTTEGYEVANVSGMGDTTRSLIGDDDLGRVVEVAYQYVGSRGRLIHPRFVRWRDDKPKEQCEVSQDPDLENYWGTRVILVTPYQRPEQRLHASLGQDSLTVTPVTKNTKGHQNAF